MSDADRVEPATAEDGEWIARLFDANAGILGNMSGGTLVWRWKTSGNPRDRMIVVRRKGFAHYLVRKDGTRTLYELAVDKACRRAGIGKMLLAAVGCPITLKTDASHHESNAFYRSAGLVCCGQMRTRAGKLMNVYQGW